MDLKLKDKDILITEATLPRSFQISLEKRGKTAVNHRYMEDIKELQIFCSNCCIWHPVYRLEDGAWIDINQTYKLCNAGKERAYFDTYCSNCYSNRHIKGDTSKVVKEIGLKAVAVSEERVKKLEGNEKYLAWSERAGGIQQTIFLEPGLDMYLKLYGVYHNKKKNQLINEIIAQFKEKNPINL